MTFKMFISDYTYRSQQQQLATLDAEPQLEGAPVYTQEDIENMLRPTQRKSADTYYAASVACFADDEVKLKKFLAGCRKKKLCLASIEEGFEWRPGQSDAGFIKAWRSARAKASGRIGGKARANKAETEFWERFEKIKDRWLLPSESPNTNKELLAEAGIGSRATIKSYLGFSREQLQRKHQLKEDRKDRGAKGAKKKKNTAPWFSGIYVIQVDEGAIKVGVSSNAGARLRDHTRDHGKNLEVVAFYRLERGLAGRVESQVHHILGKYRSNEHPGRETYITGLARVKAAIKQAIKTEEQYDARI